MKNLENSPNLIPENLTLFTIPMVNPDGVDLVNENINPNSTYYKNAVKISEKFKNIPFPKGWKANIEGTDINLNYPAGWAKAKEIMKWLVEQGIAAASILIPVLSESIK